MAFQIDVLHVEENFQFRVNFLSLLIFLRDREGMDMRLEVMADFVVAGSRAMLVMAFSIVIFSFIIVCF